MTAKTGKFLPMFAVLLLSASSCLAQSVMTHHVRDVVKSGKVQSNGRLPGNQVLQLDLVLPLRDPAGLKSFLADVYNPASSNYRQFLTPAEFISRFGPAAGDYDTVVRFAKTYGFEVVGGSRDGMLVQAKGTVSNIEAAFHVNMRTYQHPKENRTFYSPDREPTLDLPFNLWHISGLDNYSVPHPLRVSRDEYAQAHGIDAEKIVSHATTGSGPSASFLGSDMRAAYYGNGTLTGSGQNLGLFEFLGTDLADLNTYFTNIGQTNNVPITLLSTDGTSTSCVYHSGHCDDGEQTLDMTQALGMAPGLASLTMYVGSTDTSIISAMTTNNPLPTTIGCSWGWTPADPSTLDIYFQRMAAQGQNFFAASGDYSTWAKSGNAEAWPADDAYVVSVGGTDLTTASAAGPWASETAWADSGGGISPDSIAIPSWQQISGVINPSNKGSATLRNGPDVSANANFTFYTCGDQKACQANYWGGTSFAAPMWAGFVALANQQYAIANPGKTIGFINPNIYAQNVNSSTYAADFHDITSGTSGSYSAVPAYDLVTGWGSPNAGLIAALAGSSSQGVGFTLSPSASSVTAAAGTSPQLTIAADVTGTLNSNITLTYSGQPAGSSISFSPSSLANKGTSSSTMTITLPSSSPTGTYSITVTGTSGSTVVTTTVALTVTGTFTVVGPSLTEKAGGSASGTITVTSTLGSITSVAFAVSAPNSGISVSLNPSSVSPGAGSASTTITVSTTHKVPTGSYTITVFAESVGYAQTLNVPLKVN